MVFKGLPLNEDVAASQSTPPLDTWHVQPPVRMCTRIDTWHVQPSIQTTMGLTHTSPVRMSYPDSVANVSNKSLDHISQAIIIHFTKSMLNGTFLGHFRQLAMTCPAPLVEQKDKDDGKPSLPQSLMQDNDGFAIT